jgi:hypothetical protein
VSAPESRRLAPYIDLNDVLAAVIPLFARVPNLAQKLLELSKREVVGEKPHTFFDDLFVRTSGPAVGANYHVVGYRLRNPDQRDSVDGATDGNLANLDCHATVNPLVEN